MQAMLEFAYNFARDERESLEDANRRIETLQAELKKSEKKLIKELIKLIL